MNPSKALQTAATRKGNGYLTAQFATVWESGRSYTGVHVTCSADVRGFMVKAGRS